MVCGNGEDGVDSYDESVESTHSGDNNTCETAENWIDATGTGPCRYACVQTGAWALWMSTVAGTRSPNPEP